MPVNNFTSLYSVGEKVVFYRKSINKPTIFVIIGIVLDITYLAVEDKVLYQMTTNNGVIDNVKEENVFALTDTFQRLVDLVS